MNTTLQQIASSSLYGQEFPLEHSASLDSSAAGTLANSAVGQHRLSDNDREEAIKRSGDALLTAMGRKEAARRRWLESGCLLDKADADAADVQGREALRLMQELIGGRSADQIARMERERGLA